MKKHILLFIALLMVSYFFLDFTINKSILYSIIMVIIVSLIYFFDKRKNKE